MAHAYSGGVSPPASWHLGFGKTGRLGRRRRGEMIAPKLTTVSTEQVVSDCSAPAHGTIVRKCLNASRLPMIWAVATAEVRVSLVLRDTRFTRSRKKGEDRSQS